MRRHFRSALRLVVILTIAFGAFDAMPSIVEATEFQYRDVNKGLDAVWNSCGTTAAGQPCTFSQIQAWETFEPSDNGKHTCVSVFQDQGTSRGDGYPTLGHETGGGGCDIGATVLVAASLTKGKVSGDVVGQDCEASVTPPSCVPTTLSIALDWQSKGDVTRSPNAVLHESPVAPDRRCLEHLLPSRFTLAATVTGQIEGLPAPLQPLTVGFMGVGGRVDIGTIPFCFD